MNFFRKNFVLILIICVGLVGLASIIPYFTNKNQQKIIEEQIQNVEPPFTHEANLTIYKKNGSSIADFQIELAQNEIETAMGLMFRKSMPDNRGMLFIFDNEEPRYFWMKNTYIPLDIIYMDKELRIVSIAKNATALSEESRPSNFPAKYVLEVNAGLSNKLGIEEGDYIKFEKIN